MQGQGRFVETRAYEDANGRGRLSLGTRSDFDIEAQITARSATWIDRQLLARVATHPQWTMNEPAYARRVAKKWPFERHSFAQR
jgi:hypothetical protein